LSCAVAQPFAAASRHSRAASVEDGEVAQRERVIMRCRPLQQLRSIRKVLLHAVAIDAEEAEVALRV
jgi:hypothetical protein